ncbi:hypothetical protein IFM89_002383 [Coptis chinensis]|uniref:U3 small nucleolar RNA-associated protein 18 homolog n=1 Tax=Coptis chinensis TaxID=261450 RepID=A0A835IN88_9MAGN|nr:hypothetical protein IFM89_002383 [Coptis chinensis]
MASLISQKTLRKKPVYELKQEENDEPLSLQESEKNEVAKESSLVDLKSKKRKNIHNEDKSLLEEEEKEMKRHESLLFGSLYSPNEFGKEEEAGNEVKGPYSDPRLFFTDRTANGVVTVYEEDAEYEYEDNNLVECIDKKPAWEDPEEKTIRIDIEKVNRMRKLKTKEDETSICGSDRLRAYHVKTNPPPKWAQRGSGPIHDDESDEEYGALVDQAVEVNQDNKSILQTNEDLVVKSRVKLLPGILEYSRLVDANAEDPSNSAINSVQFHRNAQLLLAAGLDRRLRFFQVDGKRNTMIQSIFLEDCPIRKATFLPDGSQVIVGGRRKFFYSFDLAHAKFDRIGPLVGREEKSLEVFDVSPDSRTIAFLGNEGYILLVSCKTKELIGTLKMNGSARSLAFTDDGRQLLSSGGDGHIYHWDLRTRMCFHKAVDEGCIMGSALSTSPNGALFAAGSSSGIVNIYNQEEFLGGKRKPMKTIENLTTRVDYLKFNHDAQILAICSTMQKNSLKLVHMPSFTVFSNWPPPKQTLRHPRCLDFSPGGGFMATGNADGKVFLYKLHHYQHA